MIPGAARPTRSQPTKPSTPRSLTDIASLFADFGIARAYTSDATDDDIGVIYLGDAYGNDVTSLTVDQPGHLPTSRARALADLVAHQLNTVLG